MSPRPSANIPPTNTIYGISCENIKHVIDPQSIHHSALQLQTQDTYPTQTHIHTYMHETSAKHILVQQKHTRNTHQIQNTHKHTHDPSTQNTLNTSTHILHTSTQNTDKHTHTTPHHTTPIPPTPPPGSPSRHERLGSRNPVVARADDNVARRHPANPNAEDKGRGKRRSGRGAEGKHSRSLQK